MIAVADASSGSGLAIVVGLFFVAWAGLMVTFAVKVQQALPWGICRRLRRGRSSVTRRISYAGGAWNPAKPLGRGNPTRNEPGWATYTLTDDGMVQLDLVRRDGQREQYVGPPVDPPDSRPSVATAGWLVVATYLGFAAAAFTVVYLASPGTNATRLGTAAMAAFAGFVLAWFTLTVTVAVRSARASQQRVDS
jgi:hypothetical protein